MSVAALAGIGVGASGELLRTFWNSPFPVMLQDASHRLVALNDAFVAFSGRSRAALIGLDPAELMPEEDRVLLLAARAAGTAPTHEDGIEQRLVERRLVDGQGRERWYRAARSELDDGPGRRLTVSVLQETTAEHLAREQVDRSLRELEQWFALSPVGMVMFDRQGLIVRSNPAFEALVGQVPVALPDGDAALAGLLGWQSHAPHPALLPQAPAQERMAWIAAPDGRRGRLRSRVQAIEPAPGQLRYLAVLEDCSAEDERDLARLEIGALMDTAGVGVATFEASRGWHPRASIGGAGAAAGLQSMISRELVDAASLPDYERLQQALKRGERAEIRYAVRHPGLGLRWLLTRVEPGQLGPGRATTSVVTLDVTEQELARLRNEQLLRELAGILDGTSVGIAYLRGALLVRCNQRFERMLDLAGGRAAGATLEELFASQPALVPLIHNSLAALQSTRVFETEFRFEPAGAWYSLSVRRAAGGPEPEAVAVLTDISRLKSQQAELQNLLHERDLIRQALQLQSERTRAILDSVLVGIVTVDERGIEWMNRSARRMFGGELADFAGEPIATVATAEDDHPLRRTDWRDVLAEGQSEPFECRLQARDGRAFWVVGNVVATGREGRDGREGGGQLTFALLDIERRRQAEAAQRAAEEARFEAAIAQRDMLVKEVHHRIKNNLQGVAGLMQQIARRKPEVAPVISEAIGQVQAIAQVYGLQVGAGGPLQVQGVLEAITGSVQRMFGRNIVLDLPGAAEGLVQRWALPEAESIPIALTLNELLTNALKHSAGLDEPGDVRCTLTCTETQVEVAVANHGRLPEGFELARVPGGVSGLGLVRALLPRRTATLELAQRGTEVVARVTLSVPSVTLLDA